MREREHQRVVASRLPVRDVGPSLRAYRSVLLPGVDVVSWCIALPLATLLRYAMHPSPTFTWKLGSVVAVALAAQLVTGYLTGLYRIRWRVGSFEEMLRLAETMLATTIVVSLFDFARAEHPIPASGVVGGAVIAFLLSGATRSAWRLNWERRLRPDEHAQRALIFGAGDGGVQLVDALLHDPQSPYVPVGLLDDDPDKRHARIRHVRVVGGREELRKAGATLGVDTLIIAIPSADSILIRELLDRAANAGLSVKVLPPVGEILAGVGVGDIRPLRDEDLLGRHAVDTHVDTVANYLTSQRVLVTGAGGSIGSEVCRQIARYEPARLVMLDRDESGLHQTQLSIEGRALLDDRCLVVCDIRDREALARVFKEHQPDVVFHAAALKHLPLLEMWPVEAIKTNVVGTQNVLELAEQFGAQRCVNISTDKAANPTSVLGYTKRVAERLTAGTGRRADGTYISVRFGNVLGSRGSVLTIFRTQIEAGMPVTVTHPDVTRYFMTVAEAVQLVIHAGAVGHNGEVLVLDMGKPVRISEVAHHLVSQARVPVNIVYTGLRPGEKLQEDLFGDGEVDLRPVHPLISHVLAPPLHLFEEHRILGSDSQIKLQLRELCNGESSLETAWATNADPPVQPKFLR
jgi:FlaA1/EpsC-like NDP-sugar epimerase